MAKVKPLVISYLRFSRPEQSKGDSIRRQLALSDAWCKEHDVTIDTSLTDKGISAFRGSNAEVGALGTFLSLVETGRVPKGSTLLVESLDRLARTEVRLALTQFLNLVNAGIRVVTLGDGREYSEAQCELAELVTSIVVMSRAHEESATKSKRLTEAWKTKRAKIAEKPLTTILPNWCKMTGGKIVLDPAKAQAVKTIYTWAMEGMGLGAICKRANKELPKIGKKPYYVRSYIHKLLTNRSVIGEYQPHKIVYIEGKKKREPVGDPVENYFPVIVDETTFAAVMARANKKQKTGGRSDFISIFRGLITAEDGSRYHVLNKGHENGGHTLIPSSVVDGRSGKDVRMVGFPLPVFEAAFFSRLADMAALKLDDKDTDDLRRKLLAVEGQIEITQKKIDTLTADLLDSDTPSPSTVKVLAKLDEKVAGLKKEHEAVQAELRTAELGSPKDAAEQIAQIMVESVLHQMPSDKRMKLRSLVQQIVDKIDMAVRSQGRIKTADVTVHLAAGRFYTYTVKTNGAHQSFTIDYAGGFERLTVEGEDSGRWYEAAEIVEMRKGGMKVSEIVERTGLPVSCIYRAFKRAGVAAADIKPQIVSARWAGHSKTPKAARRSARWHQRRRSNG